MINMYTYRYIYLSSGWLEECDAEGITTFSCDLVLENSVIMWSR